MNSNKEVKVEIITPLPQEEPKHTARVISQHGEALMQVWGDDPEKVHREAQVWASRHAAYIFDGEDYHLIRPRCCD